MISTMPFRASVALCLVSAAVSMPPSAIAAPLNPEISVIGDTRAVYSDETEELSLTFEEAEISIIGPLNPYASGQVTLGINEAEGIDIEEAKLLLDRYFPGGFGLTIGKTLVDFGQLNPIHAHAFPFVDRPLMHATFFGEEGIKDVTCRLEWLAPTEGVTLRATAGVTRGDFLREPEEEEVVPLDDESLPLEPAPAPELGFTGRVDLFAEPSSNSSFLVGGSVMQGTSDEANDSKATWFGPDLKARLELSPESAVIVNAEAVFGSLDLDPISPSVDPRGWFTSVDWRANKKWNFGGFAESTTARDDDESTAARFGAFLGLGLMEETTLFRVVGRTTDPEEGESVNEVLVQALFGLGPHRAHRY